MATHLTMLINNQNHALEIRLRTPIQMILQTRFPKSYSPRLGGTARSVKLYGRPAGCRPSISQGKCFSHWADAANTDSPSPGTISWCCFIQETQSMPTLSDLVGTRQSCMHHEGLYRWLPAPWIALAGLLEVNATVMLCGCHCIKARICSFDYFSYPWKYPR